MTKDKLLKRAALNALGTTAYIALIAWVLSNGESIFGKLSGLTGPFFFLLLFVISAAITGALVLGKPAMLFASGQRAEAVQLFLYTLLCLAVLAIVVFIVFAVFAVQAMPQS